MSSKTVYIAGTNTSVSTVEVSNPPISTIAAALSNSEPASMPLATGASDAITDKLVIRIGRNRTGPA